MDFLKSFIVFALVVIATTSAFKLADNHDDPIISTFPMIPDQIYNSLNDYIQLEQESSPSIHGYPYNNKSTESFDAIVEIAIVSDKEWGDMFQHNRQRILEYWTAFFWDMNAKYQTLPSINITFRVTSVIDITSLQDQPFIENARDEEGGASFGSMLRGFGDWMGEQYEAGKIANYDIAVLAISTKVKENGIAGMAFLSQACSKNRGVGVFRDDGNLGTHVAAHEIAHILGANHDLEVSWCDARGYIMEVDKHYFFSWCSDVQISEYANSARGACLKTIDEPGNPVIGQDFGGAVPPGGLDQCKRLIGDPDAVVGNGELVNKCRDILCWRSREMGGWGIRIRLAENSPCIYGYYMEDGRCFRGRCRPQSAQLINVQSNQCLLSGSGRFTAIDNTTAVVTPCPQHQTPLNSIAKMAMNEGQYLMMSYATPDASEIDDKCFVYENDQQQELKLRFVKCSTGTGWPKGWTLVDVGNDQFLLQHTYTKMCVKQSGNVVTITENCDQNDKTMVWTFKN